MSKSLKASTWRDEYPFSSHFFQLEPGVRMHYVDEGPRDNSSQTILCVHGNPTWSFYYRSIVSRFSGSQRVVAVDHVGCGLSDKPQKYRYSLAHHTTNLVRLIDELNLDQVALVVHDWGGAIGLGAAVQRIDRFRKIMVLNTAAFPPPYIPRRIAACRIPFLGSWAIRYANAFARAAIFMAINRLPRLSNNARDGLLAPYDSPNNRVAIEGFVRDIPMSLKHPSWNVLTQLERDLPELSGLPIRFVWGMRDWCFRPECMERMNLAWPDATRRELSDVGHYVMEEAPTEVMEELKRLLDDHGK
ncbi:MAG TPA: alpha/beta fold hydrolase [Pirellula sp.]|nr:alpha/beta fold hydrolase [Pirellula sp.]